MKINKTISIFWILLTIIPAVCCIYFLYFLTSHYPVENVSSKEHVLQFKIITTIASRQIILISVVWCLIASYIVYMFKACCVSKKAKVFWIIAFFVGHIFAMPFFWYFYVWKPLKLERK